MFVDFTNFNDFWFFCMAVVRIKNKKTGKSGIFRIRKKGLRKSKVGPSKGIRTKVAQKRDSKGRFA